MHSSWAWIALKVYIYIFNSDYPGETFNFNQGQTLSFATKIINKQSKQNNKKSK